MLDDVQEDNERITKENNVLKEENDKQNKANEKILYEYKKLKDKYNLEVKEVENDYDK